MTKNTHFVRRFIENVTIPGLAQTGRQVANGDECRDLATKTMKWRHFWRQGKGLGLKASFARESCI